MDKGNKSAQSIAGILTGKFLTGRNWEKNWSFILYLSFLALIMISSSHNAERKVHRIAALNNELKELSSEFTDTRSTLMMESMESRVLQRASELGLVESEQPPFVLKTEDED